VTADTIFALASGRPPAAIAIIRISGPRAHEAAKALCGDLPGARSAEVRTLRHPVSGEFLDQAIVLRFDRPASATGEDVVELQCHGGRAVIDGVLGALGGIFGLRQAQPGEFTRRAFENGRIDLTEAEGLADLLEAETESQRKAALALAEGGLRRQIEEWQSRALALSAAAERAIDYDDDDEPLHRSLPETCAVLASELRRWLNRPRVEPLKDGVLVVVAGPPNAGKSSLINVIAGEERAIVTELPGTTRDLLEVPLAIGGIPIRLTDTAGLRETHDRVEAIGVERAMRQVEAADVLVWLGDAPDCPQHPRALLVQPKSDLPGREQAADGGALPVSAVSGAGIEQLLTRIQNLARQVLPDEGAISLNRRQADLVSAAADGLDDAASSADLPLLAENLRHTRSAFARLTGRAGIEDVLDALFSRFCLGK
jgi:tRNA modification GTPase